MNLNRRTFLAAGAGAFLLPAVGAVSDPADRTSRIKRIDLKASVADNLINEYLQPTKLKLDVGARKPFSALHFSDTHLSMLDATELLSWTAKELRLYEARNNGVFDRGGFPFAMQSLAATIAYAERKNMVMLNTGDLFDFRSEMNLACVQRSFAGRNILSALGNHEGRGLHTRELNPRNRAEDEALRAKFEAAIGNELIVASKVVNGVNFVAFDNTGLAARFRAEQFEMLEKEFSKNLPVVLMCHMPIFTPELHRDKCESMRRRGRALPKEDNLNAYYMMGENFAKTNAPAVFRKMTAFFEKQKNLKAILCGHLHFEWQGTFAGGVPMYVAGRNFNGNCYDIEFT